MKRFIVVILLALFVLAKAQTVRYAKGNVQLKDNENVMIVGAYNDTLQVLKQNPWGAIDVYLYSPDLVLIEKKVLQTENDSYASIEIIPYANFYYALLRYGGKNKYRFLKVNASGISEDQTLKVKDLLTDGSTIQKVQTEVFFISGYADTAQSRGFFRIYSADSLLTVKSKHLVELDYKMNEEVISHLVFPDAAAAYGVKSFRRHSKRAGELDIIKFDLSRNSSKTLTLSSSQDVYHDERFKYNVSDLTFILLTRVNGRGHNDSVGRYYYTKLDKELEELTPSKLIQVKQGKQERLLFYFDNLSPVIYENNESIDKPKSNVNFDYEPPFFSEVSQTFQRNPFRDLDLLIYLDASTRKLMPGQPDPDLNRTDVGMRIISLDKNGRKTGVLMNPKNGRFQSEFFNCFLSKHADRNYILYSNRHAVSRGSIRYIAVKDGMFSSEEYLPVKQRFDYLLPLSKKIGQDFIIPYKHKGKFGLLKVSFQNK